jgi:hypothetical protein
MVESPNEKAVPDNHSDYSAAREYRGYGAVARSFAEENTRGERADPGAWPQGLDVSRGNVVIRISRVQHAEWVANNARRQSDTHDGSVGEARRVAHEGIVRLEITV